MRKARKRSSASKMRIVGAIILIFFSALVKGEHNVGRDQENTLWFERFCSKYELMMNNEIDNFDDNIKSFNYDNYHYNK